MGGVPTPSTSASPPPDAVRSAGPGARVVLEPDTAPAVLAADEGHDVRLRVGAAVAARTAGVRDLHGEGQCPPREAIC
jgi:hypothetical protein